MDSERVCPFEDCVLRTVDGIVYLPVDLAEFEILVGDGELVIRRRNGRKSL